MGKKTVILFILMMVGFYYGPIMLSQRAKPISTTQILDQNTQTEQANPLVYPMPISGYEHYLTQTVDSYQSRYGEPSYTFEASNGSNWMVYQDDPTRYLQLEVNQDDIQSIYVMGDAVNTGPFRVGMTRDNILDETQLASEFHFSLSDELLTIQLTKEQQDFYPLIQYENDTFLMVFLHPDTGKIYGLRYLTAESLVELGFYQIRTASDDSVVQNSIVTSNAKTNQKEKATQFYTFINIVRMENDLPPLQFSQELLMEATALAQELSAQELTFSEFPNVNNVDSPDGFFYVSGYHIQDIPVQFSAIINNPKNRSLLLNPSYTEIAIHTIEDDSLFLVQ